MTGLPVPTRLQEVTPSWLTEALRGSGLSGTATVIACSSEAISEGKGFMSQLFRLWLDYDSDPTDLPRSVIVKLPSSDPLMRQFFDRLGQNLCEVRFYQSMAAHGTLQTPGSYYGGIDPETGNTVLLLEDMSHARQGDSVAGCTMEEARQAIGQLARFHASWWNSPVLDGLDWIPSKDDHTRVYEELYLDAWESFIGKAGDGMPPRLRLVGDRLRDEVTAIKARLASPPRTLIHGDYRLDNCFFTTADNSQPLVVFDWEFCAQGRGTYDVATFISEVFSTPRRREEEMGLLRLYHATLQECGVTDYGYDECLADYRLSMLEILVFWIVTGGYCEYDGERATAYLYNSLSRFDAAIADLGCMELLQG